MAQKKILMPRSRVKSKILTEAAEQRAIVKWLGMHPTLKNLFCKIDNEGARTPQQGFHAKLLGLRAGVSDLFIYYPCGGKHGLFVEMKRNRVYTRSERMTETWQAQERFQEIVKSVGFCAETCYGFEDAIKTINNYLLGESSLR